MKKKKQINFKRYEKYIQDNSERFMMKLVVRIDNRVALHRYTIWIWEKNFLQYKVDFPPESLSTGGPNTGSQRNKDRNGTDNGWSE